MIFYGKLVVVVLALKKIAELLIDL